MTLIVVGASLLLWSVAGAELADGSLTWGMHKYLDLYVFSRKYASNVGGQIAQTGQPETGFVFSPVLEGRCTPDDEISNTKYWTQDVASSILKENNKMLVCHQE